MSRQYRSDNADNIEDLMAVSPCGTSHPKSTVVFIREMLELDTWHFYARARTHIHDNTIREGQRMNRVIKLIKQNPGATLLQLCVYYARLMYTEASLNYKDAAIIASSTTSIPEMIENIICLMNWDDVIAFDRLLRDSDKNDSANDSIALMMVTGW